MFNAYADYKIPRALVKQNLKRTILELILLILGGLFFTSSVALGLFAMTGGLSF